MKEDTTGWHPTKAQFAAYQKREVEMAIRNLELSGFLLDTTLHSPETLRAVASRAPKGSTT